MNLITVLIADNHPIFVRSVAAFLQQHDNIVIVGTASGGEEALRRAEELEPDLVLINLTMQEPTSLETVRRLRTACPRVKIIVLSLLDSEGYRRAALSAGTDDFVSKATLTTDLMPAIRRTV